MKTIGIYKPGKTVYFYENTEDHASWSAEVTNIAKIFVRHDCHVIMLSDTDLVNEDHLTTIVDRPIDTIYVFNGVGPTIEEVDKIKAYTNDIRLIITDLKLVPKDLSIYTHIYTQSKQFHTYGAIEKNTLVDYPTETYTKDTLLYFGGTERNRLKEIIEFVWRPNVIWKGKSAFFKFNNYIPFHEHVEMLKRTKYTIVIGDETYNSIGFVTPRFYECLKYGVIPFVSETFDPDYLILPHDSMLRVHNYHDMMNKINDIELHRDREYLLEVITQNILHEEDRNGDHIYNLIK